MRGHRLLCAHRIHLLQRRCRSRLLSYHHDDDDEKDAVELLLLRRQLHMGLLRPVRNADVISPLTVSIIAGVMHSLWYRLEVCLH